MMIENGKTTALVPSVGADGGQPLHNSTEQSIPDENTEINPPEEDLQELYRRMQRMTDPHCVELRLDDGTLITINTIAVENEVADNMYQRSELDWLIYNAPLDYADLVLNGDPEKYLRAVTEYKSLDS